MPALLCHQSLWRGLEPSTRHSQISPAEATVGTRLGDWAATLVVEHDTAFVLALTKQSHLTVVFALAPQDQLRLRFSEAVGLALRDLKIPERLVVQECAAVSHVSLRYLRDSDLRETIAYTKWFCETEFMYHTDPKIVQSNLNELPHGNIDGCVPEVAVKNLFLRPRPKATLKLVR